MLTPLLPSHPQISGLHRIPVQPSQYVTPGKLWAFQSSAPFPIPPPPPPVIPRTAVWAAGSTSATFGAGASTLPPLCTATPTTTSSLRHGVWLPPSPHTSLHLTPHTPSPAAYRRCGARNASSFLPLPNLHFCIPSRRPCCYETPLRSLDPPTLWHVLTTTLELTWLGNLVGQVDVAAPDAAERWPGFSSASGVECCLRPGEILYIPLKW